MQIIVPMVFVFGAVDYSIDSLVLVHTLKM